MFLLGKNSRNLLRMGRYSASVDLLECNLREFRVPDEGDRARWWRGPMPELRRLFTIDDKHPLELGVPSKADRVRSDEVLCTIVSRRLPDGAFCLAVLDSGTSFHIPSPTYSFFLFAQETEDYVRSGKLTRAQGKAVVAQYGCELCGRYSLDATYSDTEAKAHTGTNEAADSVAVAGVDSYAGADSDEYFDAGADAHFDGVAPATTAKEIIDFCAEMKNCPGAPFARACAKLVLDLSGSPKETEHAIMLAFARRDGGAGLGRVALNDLIKLTPEEKAVFHYADMHPDLQVRDLDLYIEHLGKPHENGANYLRDSGREQDYAAIDVSMFTTTKLDFSNAAEYDKFLQRVASGLRHHRKSATTKAGKRLRKDLGDEDMTARRWELFNALEDGFYREYRA